MNIDGGMGETDLIVHVFSGNQMAVIVCYFLYSYIGPIIMKLTQK